MTWSRNHRRPGLALGLTLLLSACTGGQPAPERTQLPQPRAGGEVVLGAEGWPECINPVNQCGSATWNHWAILQHVLPRAMEIDPQGNYVASPLLRYAPSFANGGADPGPPFRVRYRIAPEAVWDDGTPITVSDFRFTWRAILATTGAHESEVYEHIERIDSPDPRVVELIFDQIVVDWPELFGGATGYVLQRAAFPDHRGPNPDLDKEMLADIPFSGGPFRLSVWGPTSAVLTRNERYYGKPALLDKVTLLPFIDQTLELEALREGQVAAIFPFLGYGGPTLDQAFGHHPDIEVVTKDDMYFEALWFSQGRGPLKDSRVREALMYAIDRQAVVDAIVKPVNPEAEVLNCGFVAFPHLGPWCETKPFARFSYDPARSRAILESAGYDCVTRPCIRDGRRLVVSFSTYAPSIRREATQALLQDRALEAGFLLEIRNWDGPFGGPGSGFEIAEFAVGGDLDPSVTSLFACDQVPTNENPGTNWVRWCNREADRLMKASDRELDPAKRLGLLTRVYELQAQDFVSLPLYVQPAVSAWRTDKIAGPIGLYSSTPHGMFFNLNEWYVPA